MATGFCPVSRGLSHAPAASHPPPSAQTRSQEHGMGITEALHPNPSPALGGATLLSPGSPWPWDSDAALQACAGDTAIE